MLGTRSILVIIALALPVFLQTVDIFGVIVAYPAIRREFGTSSDHLDWLVNAFFLTYATSFIALGRLGDLLGRRTVLLCGLALFAIASLLAGTAQSFWWLVAARLGLGFSSAMYFVNALAIVSNAVPPTQRPVSISIWTSVGSLGLSAGPLIAGMLTETLSWRWLFFINIPISMLAILLVVLVVENSKDTTAGYDIDWLGCVTISIGCAIIISGIQLGSSMSVSLLVLLGMLFTGLLVLALFGMIELHVTYPLFELRLFKQRAFFVAVSVGLLCNFGYGTIMFLPPIYLSGTLNLSMLQTGFVLLAFTIPFAVCSPLAARVMHRYGTRAAMTLGMVLACIAFAIMSSVMIVDGVIIVGIGLGVFSIAAALAYNSSTTAAQSALPDDKAGVAAGVQNTIRQLGTALGVAISGAVATGLENAKLAALLQQTNMAAISIDASVHGGGGMDPPGGTVLVEQLVHEATRYGYAGAMLVCAGVALLAVGATMWDRKA